VIPVHDEAAIEAALREEIALLFKHSPRCGASLRALGEVRRFETEGAGVPIYLLDVVSDRSLARSVAERLEIRHESPQAILLVGGQPVWHASHGGVRSAALAEQVPDLGNEA
jgi:bacillithiol system protein YtxJ